MIGLEMQRNTQPLPRSLPVVYFVCAHLALILAFALPAFFPASIAGFFYHPRMLAGVHLVTLGWITLSIVGATYLVAPFALRTNLVAGKADAWACGATVIGTSGVITHFFLERYAGLVASAALLFLGLAFVAHRVWRALRAAPVPRGVRMIVGSAWFNMLLAGLLGLLLGINKDHAFLPGAQLDWVVAHAHLAVVGWAVMMVVGIGYRLFPMFLPAAPPEGRSLELCGWLLEAGVLGFALSVPFWPIGSHATALVMIAGLGVFVFDLGRMVRNPRKRPPHLPRPDLGMLHAFQALTYLWIAAGIGLGMLFVEGWQPAWVMLYGVFGLVGFLGQMVLGMGMRLLPMFAWTAALHHGGLDPSRPPPHAIPWRPLQIVVLVTWTTGVPTLAVGLARDRHTWIAAGGWLLLVAAVLATANLARTFRTAYPTSGAEPAPPEPPTHRSSP